VLSSTVSIADKSVIPVFCRGLSLGVRERWCCGHALTDLSDMGAFRERIRSVADLRSRLIGGRGSFHDVLLD